MLYVRGVREDYDTWARLGNQGKHWWSYFLGLIRADEIVYSVEFDLFYYDFLEFKLYEFDLLDSELS